MLIPEKDKRLEPLVGLLLKYANLDFSDKAIISGQGDELDAVAVGLNIVGEELQSSLASEKKQATELQILNASLEKKAEERAFEIAKKEKKFRALIENSSDMVSLLDKNLKPIYRSPSNFRVMGWTDEERGKADAIELTHPDDAGRLKSWLKEVMENPGESIPVYFRSRHKEGYYINLEGVITNMLHDEWLQGIVANFKDVTYRKQTEEKLEMTLSRSQHAQAIAHVGHWELDLTTFRASWSEETFRIYGLEPGSAEESYELFLKYIHAEDVERVKSLTGLALQNFQPFSYQYRVVRDNREVRHLLGSGKFDFDEAGKPVRLFGVIMDVTELKEKESRLQQLNHELETFIYKSSHDLRGPIASILGLIRVAGFDIKDEAALGYLKNINELASKLDKSLADLVGVMSVKDKPLQVVPVDMKQVVDEILDSLNYMEGFQQITFSIVDQVTEPVVSDRASLHSVLLNLIENAIKYANYGIDESRVEILMQTNPEGKLLLQVTDNGTGIKKDAQEKVFDMFYRATNEGKGAGLGLYLVKKTVEKMEGIIELTSEYKKGSEFKVTIPITRS